MTIDNFNQLLVYLVFISQILFAIVALLYLFPRNRSLLRYFLRKYGLWLALAVSLTATLGSLFYSEIAGYSPCPLCWYQRIFMYPQVFLLSLAAYRKDRAIIDYSLTLLLTGAFISFYHNYIYYKSLTSAFCSLDSLESCTARYHFALDYISIPLMALTAFIITSALLWISRDSRPVMP